MSVRTNWFNSDCLLQLETLLWRTEKSHCYYRTLCLISAVLSMASIHAFVTDTPGELFRPGPVALHILQSLAGRTHGENLVFIARALARGDLKEALDFFGKGERHAAILTMKATRAFIPSRRSPQHSLKSHLQTIR